MASRPTRLRVSLRDLGNRGCETQKVCYETRDDALDAAEAMMRDGLVKPGCHLTPYQCDRCSWWHIGNRIIVALGRSDPRRGAYAD